ncbi:double-stranded RNA-binding protein Staufen homolog 1 [Polypterus senegalus]|uniref:double-stranded RNA-binding protein Staufen homolog 1 n=1 Tax=Polypterus senegalus TaxID=55291 RepID=UPI001962805F|nr:double-stranded RNA-binding protein Staufen homolog 1 [Polypterus senegalus]XP_039590864.1 double-stranded RNA-binding protein Staufen homolog 1 [Polypterus senegalus]XP_039590865.1 double-stranded RNA-binding protein Staufen homolog 1 [Polypterus senegalus]
MSQIQVQSTALTLSTGNPLQNNSQPMKPLIPQPMMSIPSVPGCLPSENAGHPVKSSSLPSSSATPISTAVVPHMANPKEKTPMCLVNELARFNKVQPVYKLLSEQGPAHSKIFAVRLALGDQCWEAEGTSIKKAQHAAAASALAETTLPKPSIRSPRHTGRNSVSHLTMMTSRKHLIFHEDLSRTFQHSENSLNQTVELNALCMKIGKKPIYKPIDPYPGMRPNFNYNVRAPGPYPRYYYPFPPVGPVLYQMELSIGGQQFHGKGRTRQAAKHDAAAKALKFLQKEPLLEKKSEINGGESDQNLNKSEISQVFEIALKRNMPVNFEVTKESGPPHMKSFVVRVSVGDFYGDGEGKSKKIAKKNAATAVLKELKKLPSLPLVEKVQPRIKKKSKSIVKLQTSPEYGQGMNPISRLAQIQQAKKEKEPEYTLITERGLPRRREFIMQVKINDQTAEGVGPNKKVAKRNAAEKMLELMGFKVPPPHPPKPALKTDEKVPMKKTGDGRKVTFFEPGCPEEGASVSTGHKDDEFRMPYLSHQQLPAGILPMVPEVAQAVGANQGHHTKDFSRPPINPAKATFTAMIARELLYGGTSPTAETILKNNNSLAHLPLGPLTRPSEQLEYLSRVQGLEVEYKDFPKNNKNEFVSLINCSSQPPLISHGIGKDVESCHDMAALNILKLLSDLDQQTNDKTGNGPMSVKAD